MGTQLHTRQNGNNMQLMGKVKVLHIAGHEENFNGKGPSSPAGQCPLFSPLRGQGERGNWWQDSHVGPLSAVLIGSRLCNQVAFQQSHEDETFPSYRFA